jgi:hypothetical protein
MNTTKSVVYNLLLLILVASLYRIIPSRPFGFAPQIAIAIFAGYIVEDKKFSFILPLLSMFISDTLYQLLFINGIGSTPGFYEGQATNYLLFAAMCVFGFFIKGINVKRILFASIAAPTTYFIISNFLVWLSTSPLAGLGRPKTLGGLMMCYADGLPFYPWSLISTLVFSALLFGSHYLISNHSLAKV